MELTTPYTNEDLWDANNLCCRIQTIQNGDILYIFHAKYPIMMLKRYANDDWQLEELELINGPFLAVNTTNISIKSNDMVGIVTLDADGDVFSETDIGRLVRVKVAEENVKPWVAAQDVSTGEVRYSDKRYYKAVAGGKTGSGKPVHSEGVRSDGGVRWEYLHDGTGIMEITTYTSARKVTAEVKRRLPDAMLDGTLYWELGMLHKGTSYPISGAFFRNRFAFLVNTPSGPNVCLSCNGDYNNFDDNELGDSTAETAITVPVLNKEFNEGMWLFAAEVLFVGTGAAEFYIDALSGASAMAADNVKISQISNVGSKAVMPVAVGSHVFFADRYGTSLRDLTYNYYNDGYDQVDVSLLGKHLFTSRIVAMSYQEVPDKVLWCLMGDGTLTALTFSAEQEVAALSRHDFTGVVESIAVIPNMDDCRDELWLEVNRLIDNKVKRTIEWVDNGMPQTYPQSLFVIDNLQKKNTLIADYVQKMASYLDGAVLYMRGYDDNSEVVSGLSHLEGQIVSLFADGAVLPQQMVINGQVKIKREYSRVLVGLPIYSQYIPQNIYLASNETSGIGEKQRIDHVLLMLYLSGGGQIGPSQEKLCDILYRSADGLLNKPQRLFSGNKEILFNGATSIHEQAASIFIENSSPLPMNILAIIPSLN